MQETGIRFHGPEDPLEEEMATHSSILAWKIPQTEEPSRLQSMGSQRARHDWACMRTLSCCAAAVDSFQFSEFQCPPKDKDVFLGVNTPGSLRSRGPWESLVLCFLSSTYNSVSTFLSLLASRNQEKANIFLWNCVTVLKFKLSVQFSSITVPCPTLCDLMDCSTPGLPVHHQFPEITQTHVHRIGGAIQPSHPLSSPSSAFHLSQYQGLFQWVTSHQVPKYWSLCFNISPSNEHSRMISFRMDWLDLLAVQGTLKSLVQHHSSKASILWDSAFFIVQLSHPYLARWTFVDK